MIEQWYAKHKVTGEIFCHKDRYVFSEDGLKKSIRNKYGTWVYNNKSKFDYSMKIVDNPLVDWELRKVELT